MNFIVELGNEFDGTAKKIASSNEEAGARLQVAFNEMRLGVGRALVGTGADLQNAFTQFIQVTTPSVINATKQIVKNIDLVVAALGTFAAVVGGAKLIGAIKLLTLTLAANPLFAGAAIAAGVVTGIVAINNALNGTARELEAITKAGAKPGATGAEKALAISTLRQQIADQQNIIDRGATGQGGKARYDKAVARKSLLERRLKDVTAVRPAPKPTSERDFKYKPITPDGDSGAASKAEALARQQEALYQRLKPQLTQTNQLLNEGNKFEQLRIKERFKAVALIKQIKEGVKEANQQELIDLVELNKEEAMRNINLEERKQKLEEMFSMDFAGLFEPQQNKIQEFISGAENSLKDLQQVAVNISQGIGNAVANSLVNGIQGLVDGSAKAKDVFADLLRSVGQVLSQEGAKMIATYISIGIAKIFAGFGQPKFGELGSFEMGTGLTGFASQTSPSGFNPGALFGGKASGGPVNAGRPYVVGERGPELFVPGQNGGVMRNEEMRQLMGRSPAGANGSAASMNFTFETTNIGGTEYVSREQLESAMATTRRQAANDGAKRGMNMTLDKMQNSPRTRSRIGIS